MHLQFIETAVQCVLKVFWLCDWIINHPNLFIIIPWKYEQKLWKNDLYLLYCLYWKSAWYRVPNGFVFWRVNVFLHIEQTCNNSLKMSWHVFQLFSDIYYIYSSTIMCSVHYLTRDKTLTYFTILNIVIHVNKKLSLKLGFEVWMFFVRPIYRAAKTQ